MQGAGPGPEEMTALADTLLPGDGEFPSASAVGAHGVATARLLALGLLEPLAQALQAAGGPLANRAEPEREAILRRLEAAEPALFLGLRQALYFAYYEQPAVVAVIRALGFDYNNAPQPRGYPLEPFDPAFDLPREGRGHYVRTEEVRRVDLSGLDFLSGGGQ